MAENLQAPPVLSTPAEHVFEDPTPPSNFPRIERTEDELRSVYEISRTARELKNGGWQRIALQFPDLMLPDAPWIAAALSVELSGDGPGSTARVYILADTSYSACCVDEIAAEHVAADVVVHYGRSCLSPTARLPVIYVFTTNPLDVRAAAAEFTREIPDKAAKAVVMADVTYQDHVSVLYDELQARGYENVLQTQVVHNPAGKIPNRTISASPGGPDMANSIDLQEYSIFHIATPPTALLLALSSRVKSFHVMPAPTESSESSNPPPSAARTRALLGRRYARVLTLATAGIIGILINTLSVSNYLPVVEKLKRRIAQAGKKSYTIVVGKLNPAKLANFAEVEGWVVVGCWESGLVEDESFYKPVITPFELDVALTDERERIWGVEWWAGIEGVEDWKVEDSSNPVEHTEASNGANSEYTADRGQNFDDGVDEDEDEPPEFDLRTGKLISKSRPMRSAAPRSSEPQNAAAEASSSKSLVMRTKGELATIKGAVSPGAEYLRSQRTWTGLGSDFAEETSTLVQEGRSGIARGYTVGDDSHKT